ncbi:hypothetical protein M758_6G010300 [Ceratodon purpureus]|nr:hypothetical protein M758_6G010300 [Ceratodon purpureus]
MPLPVLRRSNSQRTREHRRIHNKYSLGLQLLCVSIVCISALLTIYELSSAWNPGVGDGSRQMVDLARARSVQWSSLHANHLRFQGSEEGNHLKVARVEATEASESEVGSDAGPVLFSENTPSRSSDSSTFGQRLVRFLAPWISSAKDVKLTLQVPVQIDNNEVDRGCKIDDTASPPGSEIPRVFSKCWKSPNRCGTVEEMGSIAAGNTRAASLRIREMIKTWMLGHGAEVVRNLPGSEFCERKFVMGLASEDGFGNNMYKVLSAAGLALMLNRSLIIGERGANTPSYIGDPNNLVFPFGDYLLYSNQSFNMQEVKHLWTLHDCGGKHKRPMTMRVDDIEHGPGRSKSLCDDWTTNPNTVLWFKGTMDTVGLQFLLKNQNAAMRSAAAAVLGNPAFPSSRPNTFGELLREFVTPSPDIQAAVEWALKGGSVPDFAVHLRLRHNRSLEAPTAASDCLLHILQGMEEMPRKKQRVVIISDTPEVFNDINQQLGETMELIRFDYKEYLNTFKNLSAVMSLHYGQPPRSKLRDWGEMPRWVSLVDFFLAARAKVAVISAASERICTTYAQLVGSLAAASTLSEDPNALPPCALFSSFHPDLVAQGLMKQSGWGHAWRTFGGRLGCKNQAAQCARTPLLPYAWWDAPWQSPIKRDIYIMRGMGIEVDEVGTISEETLDRFCESHERLKPTVYNSKLPAF